MEQRREPPEWRPLSNIGSLGQNLARGRGKGLCKASRGKISEKVRSSAGRGEKGPHASRMGGKNLFKRVGRTVLTLSPFMKKTEINASKGKPNKKERSC